MNDLKFAIRQLFKSPGFTAVAALTLALGIGASTAIFSVVYGVLISPYPYSHPEEIWTPGLRSVSSDQTMRSYPLEGFQRMAKLPGFADVMATSPGQALLTGEFAPESLRVVRLSGNAFRFIGVPPLLGRSIQPSDILPSGEAEPVTVLSYGCWQRLFGGNINALGKTLRLDDKVYTIVGVMPPRFGWWTSDGIWLPLPIDSREKRSVFPIVRLEHGVSPAAATQQLHTLHLDLAKERPSDFPKDEFNSKLTNYLDITVASGEMQQSLWMLGGAVGFLLLIACANVANLQLARSTIRMREMAIRLSVGAKRSRLVRQLLTESVVLSLFGGCLGLIFAAWITHLMVTLMPASMIPNEARIEINTKVLLFSFAVSTLTGVLFGLAPALHSSRGNLTEALKDSSRGTSGSIGGRTREILVVAEVVLSVVLLVSAGLTIRSFAKLQRVELGFRTQDVLLASVPLPPKRYSTLEQRTNFARELLERLGHLPGVKAAALGNFGTPFGGPSFSYTIEGRPAPDNGGMLVQLVTPGYLETFGIRLKKGRTLTERDLNNNSQVALINEAAARLWPEGIDPIGRSIRLDELTKLNGSVLVPTNISPDITIIGIVGDRRNSGPQKESQPEMMLPSSLVAPPNRDLAILATVNPMQLLPMVREQLKEIDKEQPLGRPSTIEEQLGFTTAQPRFIMALFSLFAVVGLTLASAGVYSVLSFLVTQRTREIGVRMALGARRNDVLGLFLKRGSGLIGIGLLVGLPASLGVTHLLGSRISLFQVTAYDPVSLLGVSALFSLVALAACYIPARRATRVDPMVVLRQS